MCAILGCAGVPQGPAAPKVVLRLYPLQNVPLNAALCRGGVLLHTGEPGARGEGGSVLAVWLPWVGKGSEH